jgi:shikimate kinase
MANIILTGFMGTGKTSVGKRLASKTGLAFCDIDSSIVELTGKSIKEIFATEGEAKFREIETSVIRSTLKNDNQVISTGGGAVISDVNRGLFRSTGFIVNLTAQTDVLMERLQYDDERPLLLCENIRETISKMLCDRESYYADADIRIDTTGKKIEDVTEEIICFIENGYTCGGIDCKSGA